MIPILRCTREVTEPGLDSVHGIGFLGFVGGGVAIEIQTGNDVVLFSESTDRKMFFFLDFDVQTLIPKPAYDDSSEL